MRVDLRDLLRLAVEAIPKPVIRFEGTAPSHGDDEGSARQVRAENIFYEALCAFIARCGTHDSNATWEAYETYCLKATTRERIKEGIRIAVEADNER